MGAANLKADYWTALRRRALARARAHTDHLMAPPALLCGGDALVALRACARLDWTGASEQQVHRSSVCPERVPRARAVDREATAAAARRRSPWNSP